MTSLLMNENSLVLLQHLINWMNIYIQFISINIIVYIFLNNYFHYHHYNEIIILFSLHLSELSELKTLQIIMFFSHEDTKQKIIISKNPYLL